MLYKCDHCSYATKRRGDLIRHENRKISCIKKIEEVPCNLEEGENVTLDGNNVTPDGNNVTLDGNNVTLDGNNVTLDGNNVTPDGNNVTPDGNNVTPDGNNVTLDENILKCNKCDKVFKCKKGLRYHTNNCIGLHPLQCVICLKMFKSAVGKSKHKKYVKCTPPAAPAGPSTINNTYNTTNNYNNTINLNIRGNFDKITKEDIQNIVKQLEQSDYIKMIQNNMSKGKYAIPRTIEHLYFNDDHPTMQTLKKERRNDKMVEVHVDGKWEKRLIDDIMKKLISKVEDYHTDYFKYLEEKFKDIPIGSKEWNIAVRPIKNFGHMMLWYNGFSGRDIENIGIELNSPDDDKEKKAKNKDMAKIVNEKIYEFTPKTLIPQ
jgi:hypothetical protein